MNIEEHCHILFICNTPSVDVINWLVLPLKLGPTSARFNWSCLDFSPRFFKDDATSTPLVYIL